MSRSAFTHYSVCLSRYMRFKEIRRKTRLENFSLMPSTILDLNHSKCILNAVEILKEIYQRLVMNLKIKVKTKPVKL